MTHPLTRTRTRTCAQAHTHRAGGLTLALTLGLLLGVSACDDSTGPEGANVSGDWSGVASFASGFTARMNLTQTGTAVTGTMTVAGGFIDAPVTGTVEPDGRRLAWAVLDGCEAWGGTLDLDGTGESMEGPILIDYTGCASGTNTSGTLRLSR